MQHIHPSDFERILASKQAQQLSPVARERLGWIAYVVRQRCSISDACVHLGISRSSLHRWLERFDPNDLSSLEEKSHEPHSMRASNVPQHMRALIRAYREREPLMGKERIRELLHSEHGIDLSSSTIGRVIERECLYFAQTPLHWRKRMRDEKQDAPIHAATPTATQQAATISQPMTLTPIVNSNPTPTPTPNPTQHDCLLCRIKRTPTKTLKRALILTSILTNVAIAALFVATVIWESKNPPPLPADATGHRTVTETVTSLDN